MELLSLLPTPIDGAFAVAGVVFGMGLTYLLMKALGWGKK